jgi:hypothetical protein
MADTAAVKRVFIVGCRRSGTTWTMLLLGQHPNVVALQQIDFFRRLSHFGRWFRARDDYGTCALSPGCAWGSRASRPRTACQRVQLSDAIAPGRYVELVRPLARGGLRELAAVNPDARAVVEQTPEYVQVWEEVLRVLPDAHFLHVVRDPRSVFCSHRSAARSWADPTRFSYDPLSVGEEWVADVTRARAIAAATPRYTRCATRPCARSPSSTSARSCAGSSCRRRRRCASARSPRARSRSCAAAATRRKGFFRKGEVSGWKAEMSAREVRAARARGRRADAHARLRAR